jgi:hypothetical protein
MMCKSRRPYAAMGLCSSCTANSRRTRSQHPLLSQLMSLSFCLLTRTGCITAAWQPKVNVALWNTIQLLFPKHAAAAPPPTPLAPPAVGAAAAAGSRARAAATQRQSHSDMLAAGASGGVFAAHERAARQSFRPPR